MKSDQQHNAAAGLHVHCRNMATRQHGEWSCACCTRLFADRRSVTDHASAGLRARCTSLSTRLSSSHGHTAHPLHLPCHACASSHRRPSPPRGGPHGLLFVLSGHAPLILMQCAPPPRSANAPGPAVRAAAAAAPRTEPWRLPQRRPGGGAGDGHGGGGAHPPGRGGRPAWLDHPGGQQQSIVAARACP